MKQSLLMHIFMHWKLLHKQKAFNNCKIYFYDNPIISIIKIEEKY